MVLQQCSWARFTRGDTALAEYFSGWVLLWAVFSPTVKAADALSGLELELRPRVCTLAADDQQCRTQAQVSWRSAGAFSLCLVILERPELTRCWESASEGNATVDLVAAKDVTVELTDATQQHVLASSVMRVVRESVRYRPRRRQPWSLFE